MFSFKPKDLEALSLPDLQVLKTSVEAELQRRKSFGVRLEKLNIQFLNTMAYVTLDKEKTACSYHSKLEATKKDSIRPFSVCYTHGFGNTLNKEFCVATKEGPLGVRLLKALVKNILEVDFMEENAVYIFKLFDVEGVSQRLARLEKLPPSVVSSIEHLPILEEGKAYYQLVVSDERGFFPRHHKFVGQNLGQIYLQQNIS